MLAWFTQVNIVLDHVVILYTWYSAHAYFLNFFMHSGCCCIISYEREGGREVCNVINVHAVLLLRFVMLRNIQLCVCVCLCWGEGKRGELSGERLVSAVCSVWGPK